MIGDIEGYVRHIHLRATEITTLNRANIFIPNSELISKNVTNFMVRNKKSGLSCFINVAYDSNIETVKEILQKIAMEHPGISKDKKDIPKVFCKTLGENAINFELFCVLTDVDNKSTVQSDLNMMIIREFAKNDIRIPLPQQDVHIRDWTKV
jgi:small-conductance mechanosensitive channel